VCVGAWRWPDTSRFGDFHATNSCALAHDDTICSLRATVDVNLVARAIIPTAPLHDAVSLVARRVFNTAPRLAAVRLVAQGVVTAALRHEHPIRDVAAFVEHTSYGGACTATATTCPDTPDGDAGT
jgi:hypothetical protein